MSDMSDWKVYINWYDLSPEIVADSENKAIQKPDAALKWTIETVSWLNLKRLKTWRDLKCEAARWIWKTYVI